MDTRLVQSGRMHLSGPFHSYHERKLCFEEVFHIEPKTCGYEALIGKINGDYFPVHRRVLSASSSLLARFQRHDVLSLGGVGRVGGTLKESGFELISLLWAKFCFLDLHV